MYSLSRETQGNSQGEFHTEDFGRHLLDVMNLECVILMLALEIHSYMFKRHHFHWTIFVWSVQTGGRQICLVTLFLVNPSFPLCKQNADTVSKFRQSDMTNYIFITTNRYVLLPHFAFFTLFIAQLCDDPSSDRISQNAVTLTFLVI